MFLRAEGEDTRVITFIVALATVFKIPLYNKQQKILGVRMEIKDHGGRRSGFERRQLSQPINFPERRSAEDRRSGVDRRSGLDRRSKKGFRAIVGMDRRKSFYKGTI